MCKPSLALPPLLHAKGRQRQTSASQSNVAMAACSSKRFTVLTDLPSELHQPTDHISKTVFWEDQSVQRSFQASWFKKWTFLHYIEDQDVVVCHTCASGFVENKIKAANADASFVSAHTWFAGFFYVCCDLLTDIKKVFQTGRMQLSCLRSMSIVPVIMKRWNCWLHFQPQQKMLEKCYQLNIDFEFLVNLND